MNKLKMCCVESDASDQPFKRFCRMIFPVTDDRVADCRKLRSDLILQSSHQRNLDQCRAGKKSLDEISKFSARRCGVAPGAQLLKHSDASEMVNKSSLLF